jgi:hypothetical protein
VKKLIAYAFLSLALFGCQLESTSVKVSGTPVGSAQLNWVASPGVVTGYKIESSSDNVNFSVVQTVGATSSATVNNLTLGQTYYFKVIAYNAGGDSPASSVTSI